MAKCSKMGSKYEVTIKLSSLGVNKTHKSEYFDVLTLIKFDFHNSHTTILHLMEQS